MSKRVSKLVFALLSVLGAGTLLACSTTTKTAGPTVVSSSNNTPTVVDDSTSKPTSTNTENSNNTSTQNPAPIG